MADNIEPSYYGKPGEKDDLIAFTYKHNIGALEFNVMKYVMRHGKKNGLEDLAKAKTYLDRLIEYETEKTQMPAPKPKVAVRAPGQEEGKF